MNMKKYISLFCLFSGLLFFQGCLGTIRIGNAPPPSYEQAGPPPWAPAHGHRAKHRYHYYPISHVYHERDRGMWFYYRNGDWRVSVSLPSEIIIDVNDYVVLEMDDDRPYRYHQEVVKRYPPGQLKKKNDRRKWKD
ncbi:MAG: hypothetical protein JW882_12895 [Deltaproteobacteria bacterium]|nr:hypothetical protein [Deltaproteobacteria bacterium]